MNQDDFRQLVASRDARDESQRGYGGKRNLSEVDLAEIKKLSVKKANKKSKKPKNAMPADNSELQAPKTSSLYRDRAAERRRGGTGDMVDAGEYKHFNTEQSKFLGGDMEHTHLVKGLDYALLAQLKREKETLLAQKQKQIHTTATVEAVKPTDNKLTFKTRMGRLVYFHACQSTAEASVKSELFLPGRMDYTFNLSAAEIESIPVSVQRSKEDCPEPDEVVSGILEESLIDRVAEIVSCKKKMRKRRKIEHHRGEERRDAEVPKSIANVEIQVAEDEEDIFPDVGEYVPIDQRMDDASADTAKKEAIKNAGYFSNLSASITENEETARKKEEDAERAWKETLQKAVETQKKIEREKERKEKEAKMAGQTDDYAEYQGMDALGGDSDDDDDEETARRRKKAGLDRKDVDVEEKTRRKKQKQSSKLANDLEKINKVRQHEGDMIHVL
ncbi:Suppressor of mec-8 and unc-52 2 [Phytophthora citrophthora]|uniref:Suppressor of mec-8 and unc-52 2 n=1 Tax=Phytophthora citrophthora TaxID=4793 RepID=A0AAD9LQI3_9STRA|nr:Suppressor of mec-8 and unc-52 2 [Phytophthora citrophthora]